MVRAESRAAPTRNGQGGLRGIAEQLSVRRHALFRDDREYSATCAAGKRRKNGYRLLLYFLGRGRSFTALAAGAAFRPVEQSRRYRPLWVAGSAELTFISGLEDGSSHGELRARRHRQPAIRGPACR